MKSFQIGDEEVAADRIACADSDLPACGCGFQELRFALLDEVHGRFYVAHQYFTLGSELYFFRAPNKECLIKLPLQSLDRLADGRLGDEKLLGCLGKIQCGSNVIKNLI